MNYYEFRVSLLGVKPPPWRNFLLRADTATFRHLHHAIQMACGWENSHLFAFRSPGRRSAVIAGIPDDMDLDLYGKRLPDAKRVRLSEYFRLPNRAECWYEYDFGDSWLHKVVLVGETDLPETFRRRLIGGERAFPPEDCGGIPGYERFSEFVRTGVDLWEEDPEEVREWLGDWHPERFDFEEVRRFFDSPKT